MRQMNAPRPPAGAAQRPFAQRRLGGPAVSRPMPAGIPQAPAETGGIHIGQAPQETGGIHIGQAPQPTGGIYQGQAPQEIGGIHQGRAPMPGMAPPFARPPMGGGDQQAAFKRFMERFGGGGQRREAIINALMGR